jgi:hypothetical protein
MGFEALAYAQKFRDIIRELVVAEVKRVRPSESFAEVTALNTTAGTCTVKFPGETATVTVRMFTIQPAAVGCVVRVAGDAGFRYVSEVISGRGAILLRSPNGTRYRVMVADGGAVSATAV